MLDATIARLQATEPTINAFVFPTLGRARTAAAAADEEAKVGAGAALLGVPITVKDLIAVRGERWTFGSRTREEAIADVDAPTVARLEAAGAVIVGKTTTPEFGSLAAAHSPLTGITRNPWDPSLTPGGSSGGAAAALAAGVAPLALATDAGGSIRLPAAFTLTFGLKPQFGRVPIYPPSGAPTVAHHGPMARTVRDAALMLSVLSGFDPRDPNSAPVPQDDWLAACDAGVAGMRIAWSEDLGYVRPDPEVVAAARAAVELLAAAGAHVEEAEPGFDDPIGIYRSDYAASNGVRFRELLDQHREHMDPDVVRLIESARGVTLEEIHRDRMTRQALRETLAGFFERYDLLATPAAPTVPFAAGRIYPEARGAPDDLLGWLGYTYPFNLTGHPAASVPAALLQGRLPIGLQLVSRPWREADIFRAAAVVEAATGLADRHPPI